MTKYKVAITDDHLLFAEGISNIIARRSDMQLCFIAPTIDEMNKQLQQEPVDFLLLDINMPPHNGIEVMGRLKEQYPLLKIMILSMYQPMDIGLDVKQFKGDAYVLKISGKEILEEALECMKNGEPYLDPNIVQHKKFEDAFTSQLKLTKREKEIIALIAAGKTTKEIASLLFLSELTIKTHRKNISEKLGTKGMADLISKTIHYKNS